MHFFPPETTTSEKIEEKKYGCKLDRLKSSHQIITRESKHHPEKACIVTAFSMQQPQKTSAHPT